MAAGGLIFLWQGGAVDPCFAPSDTPLAGAWTPEGAAGGGFTPEGPLGPSWVPQGAPVAGWNKQSALSSSWGKQEAREC